MSTRPSVQLTAGNSAVDHHRPTFDELLFNFCRQYGINPLVVQVGSLGGARAEIGRRTAPRSAD